MRIRWKRVSGHLLGVLVRHFQTAQYAGIKFIRAFGLFLGGIYKVDSLAVMHGSAAFFDLIPVRRFAFALLPAFKLGGARQNDKLIDGRLDASVSLSCLRCLQAT